MDQQNEPPPPDDDEERPSADDQFDILGRRFRGTTAVGGGIDDLMDEEDDVDDDDDDLGDRVDFDGFLSVANAQHSRPVPVPGDVFSAFDVEQVFGGITDDGVSSFCDVESFSEQLAAEIGQCWSVVSYESCMLRWLRGPVDSVYEVDSELNELKVCGGREEDLLAVICKSHGLQTLCELETNQTEQCGRVFSSNEVIYQCLDCAVDPTCVLCSSCFMNSEHRNHRYRVQHSDGGGFCDCGDEEAWTSGPNCDLHPTETEESLGDLADFAPANSVRFLANLVHLCRDVLFAKSCENSTSTDQQFVALAYNDEIHSFADITSIMSESLDRTRTQGYDMAQIIDRVGRGILVVDSRDVCLATVERIRQKMLSIDMPDMIVCVSHVRMVKWQRWAVRVLDRIEQMVRRSKRFRMVFSEAMFSQAVPMRSDYATGKPTLLATILPDCDHLWKEVRAVFTRLMVVNILDVRWKSAIAEYFIANHNLMWEHYLTMTDDNHCCADLSVQFLTTPSLAFEALRDHHGLTVILRGISQRLRENFKMTELENANRKVLAFNAEVSYRSMFGRKTLKMMNDVRHILQSVHNAALSHQQLTDDQTQYALKSGAASLVEFMSLFEGTSSFRRQMDVHVLQDPEWESAFVFLMKIRSSTRFLYQIVQNQVDVLADVTKAVIESIALHLPDFRDQPAMEEVVIAGNKYSCLENNVLRARHSPHHPATRFLTGLLVHLAGHSDQRIDEFQEAVNAVNSRFSILQLIQSPLSLRVLAGQAGAQMWIKNGMSILNSLHLLSSSQCSPEMSDRDLNALQIAAAYINNPDLFLAQIINRYGLSAWASFEDYAQPGLTETGYTYKQTIAMVESMLDLLMHLTAERYSEQIGQITRTQWYRRQLVHVLALKPNVHTAIIRKLDESAGELDETNASAYESVLEQISDRRVRQTAESNVFIYSIKPEIAESEFDPYFQRYTKSERNEAEHVRMEWKRTTKSPGFLPVPNPPKFRRAFQSIPDILECSLMVEIYKRIMKLSLLTINHSDETNKVDRHRLSSNSQLRKTLDLMSLAARRPPEPGSCFSQNSEVLRDLLDQLVSCEHLSELKDHATWVRSLIPSSAESSQEPSSAENQAAAAAAANELRKQMARERKARMLAMMAEKQKSFAIANEVDLETVRMADNLSSNNLTCIICQDKQSPSLANRPMGVLSYVQRSNVLLSSGSKIESSPPRGMASVCEWGVHISSCGHMMHVECYHSYFTNLQIPNEMAAPLAHLYYEKQQNEFPCPLCRALNNCLLPIFPALAISTTDDRSESPENLAENFDSFVEHLHEVVVKHPPSRSISLPLEDPSSSSGFGRQPPPLFESAQMLQIMEMSLTQLDDSSSKRRFNSREVNLWLFGEPDDQNLGRDLSRTLTLFGERVRNAYHGTSANDMVDTWPLWNASTYSLVCHQQFLQLSHKNLFNEQEIPSNIHILLSQLFPLLFFQTLSGTSQEAIPAFKQALEFLVSPSAPLDTTTELDTLNALICLLCTYTVHLDQDNLLGQSSIASYFVEFTRIAWARHCVNVVRSMSHKWTLAESYVSDGSETRDNLLMQTFIHLGGQTTNKSSSNVIANAGDLRAAINRASLPFMRALCYLKRFIVGQPFNDIMADAYGIGEPEMEASTYLDYLDLSCQQHQDLWVLLFKHSLLTQQPLYPHYLSTSVAGRQILTSLPSEYVLLLTPGTMDIANSRQAYLCLICGEVICVSARLHNIRTMSFAHHHHSNMTLDDPSDFFGDVEGRAVAGDACRHVAKCTPRSGCGILLRIKECLVICLQIVSKQPLKVRGAKMSAPFANEFGEPDDLLRRGDRLLFSQKAYDNIKKIWIGHSVPQTTSKCGQSFNSAYALHWESM